MVPKTIENTREADETVCRPDDEEVKFSTFFFFSMFKVLIFFNGCSCLRISMLMSLILS